ncbi:MAG: ADP/ATP-dependent (S)-NAD(P)H-hydrate dehydratase [Microgenomates group bacterium]
MAEVFNKKILKELYKPAAGSTGEDNGQVTIIGGSSLFHGAPIFSLKVASRIVDMVFFGTPEESVGQVAEKIKSKLLSFVWIPWEDTDEFIQKSDAVLIGPGFMRFKSEKTPHGERHRFCDRVCQESREITERFLSKFPKKKWVIDAGSLQVMEPDWIPNDAIVIPNKKEYKMLFGSLKPEKTAKKFNCNIICKGRLDLVCSPEKCVEVKGGNPGMTKGGTGDVLAGLAVALLAKNNPFLAACAASYITKMAADELYRPSLPLRDKKVGIYYNADDLADKIPETLYKLIR